jgi:hypothetical protein
LRNVENKVLMVKELGVAGQVAILLHNKKLLVNVLKSVLRTKKILALNVAVAPKKKVMELAAVFAQVAVALKAVVLRVGLLVLLIQLLQIAVVVPVQAVM